MTDDTDACFGFKTLMANSAMYKSCILFSLWMISFIFNFLYHSPVALTEPNAFARTLMSAWLSDSV